MRIFSIALTVWMCLCCGRLCLGQGAAVEDVAAEGQASADGPPPPARWWALLMAAEDYPAGSDLRPLHYCHADMAALRNDWLISAGVPADQIVLMHDNAEAELRPTKANIERELAALTERLGPEDVLLIGAAMHGARLGDETYLCPLDADVRRAIEGGAGEGNLISLPSVFDAVSQSQASFKLLIVDACRQAIRPDLLEGKDSRREFVATLNRLKQDTRGLAVLTSCSEGQQAYEYPEEQHGAFMYALMKALDGSADLYGGNNDGVVTLREAASYANRVTKSTMFHKFRFLQEPDLLMGEATMNFPLRVVEQKPDEEEDDLAFMARYGDRLVHWTNLGRAEHYDLAIDLLSHAVRSQPDQPDNYARRAFAYRSRGDYSLALADFRKAGTSLELFVRRPGVSLQVPGMQSPALPPGSRLSIIQIQPDDRAQDDWLWVSTVDNDPAKSLQGWVRKSQVVWDPGLAELVLPVTPQRQGPDQSVLGRLNELANNIAYQPPYIPTAVGLPGLPVRPRVAVPWVYIPDPRWRIGRPAIPIWERPVIPVPYIPYVPYWRSYIPF